MIVIELLFVVIQSIKEYLRPRYGSLLLKHYPPRTILEIERDEPFKCFLDGRFIIEIPQLSVDQSLRIAQLQYQVRENISNVDKLIPNEKYLIKARILSKFYDTIIRVIYNFSKARYKTFWERRTYFKVLKKVLREDVEIGYKIFDALLKYNSEIESFFFDSVKDDRGKVQLPNRNSWTSIGCEYRKSGRGSYLQAKILTIFLEIVQGHEDNEIQSILSKVKPSEF